jgi:hypothetical protein
MWFYQEWKETENIPKPLIIGLFWIYEVYEILMRKNKKL